jgi:hypothetical protein
VLLLCLSFSSVYGSSDDGHHADPMTDIIASKADLMTDIIVIMATRTINVIKSQDPEVHQHPHLNHHGGTDLPCIFG